MKNGFLKYFLGFIIHVFCLSVFAQTELRGKVADFSDYMPIVSANIYIQNTTLGTISNSDGKFVLVVPREFDNDTLVISSIGYKSFKVQIGDFDTTEDIFLETDIASLDEVLIVAETRPKTGNEIVLRAIEELSENLPEQPYLQKGFLRHRERNRKEYKWLIESAITLYDSSYASGAKDNLKINVDENRKSYDLREVDSLYAYAVYLKYQKKNTDFKSKKLNRDTIETASLIEAIKWNDRRINGLENIFKGRLNLLRNSNIKEALFGDGVLDKHQFELDTILVDDGRKLFKIKISKSTDFVGLNTENIYNEGYQANGWLYVYWDTYAIKKIEYELVAASKIQKGRSKSLYGTQINHKLIMTYTEYQGKMYPNYFYYETPKLVNVGNRSSDIVKVDDKDTRFYYTVQEILFTEIIQDPEIISGALLKDWSEDIFSSRPYNKEFWKNYNVLLESEEEEKLIQDLSKRATLFKQ
jgi:hypothetical protein